MKQIIAHHSKIILGLAALVFTLGLGTAVALAQSPHFLTSDFDVNSSGALVCHFKEAGLGNTTTVADITCAAEASTTYFCINKGGNHPQAGDKETVTGAVSYVTDVMMR